jgi:4a-hydroxytetrahydrobiopterin dehydratase
MTPPPLRDRHCEDVPKGTPPMADAEIDRQLTRVEGWRHVGGALERSFDFPDFHRTMAFVNAVAWICHVEDHHPDLAASYGRCTLRFNTHTVGGISLNDFICAAKVDALVAR